MKSLIMYQCEMCKDTYDNPEEAIKCESRGVETPLLKVGQLIDYEVLMNGGFPSFWVEQRIGKIEDHGHYLVYQLEEFNEDFREWTESNYKLSGIWGNDEFNKRCRIKNKLLEVYI